MDVTHYVPGDQPVTWRMGDYLLISSGSWRNGKRGPVPFVSRMIQIGQRLRFRGARRQYAHWNHAVWVSSDGLIEALAAGVTFSPFEKYRDVEYDYVHSNLTPEQRSDADAFVRWALAKHERYGFVTILSLALSLLTGLKFNFGLPGTCICSGLVAAALAAPQWREDPSHVLPADLAEYANITSS